MSGTSQKVPNRALITLCVMMGNLMQSLDASIANVSLPYMQGTLSISAHVILNKMRHHGLRRTCR
jgi:hypothetical protein